MQSVLIGQNIDSLRSVYYSIPNGIEKHKVAIDIAHYFDILQSGTDSIIKYTEGFEEFVQTYPNHPLIPITNYHILSSHYKQDSVQFFNEGLQLIEESKQNKNYDIIGKTVFLMAGKYRVMSGFIQGIKLLEDGINFLKDQQDLVSLNHKAKMYSLLASLNVKQGNFHKALEYGLKVQTLSEVLSDERLLLRSYFNLGVIYGNLSSEEKKLVPKKDRLRYRKLNLKYHQLAYDFCKDKPISRTKGIAVYNLGLYYSMNENFEASKKLLTEAIDIGKTLPWNELLYNAYDVVSADMAETGKMDSSYFYILKADSLAKKMNSPYHVLSSQINFGNYFMMNNNLEKARKQSLEALKISKERKFISKEVTIYDLLHQIEDKDGNHQKSFEYFRKNRILKDSISGENHLKQINALKAQHDYEQQKVEIEALKKDSILKSQKIDRKNSIIVFSILIGVLLSCLMYLLYRGKILKAQKRELSAQQKLLRTQLNPHFLFNALNSIQQYIYLQKEPKLVADYLAKFSRLTRRILHNSNQDLIELKEEVDFLKDYMDLQKLRFDVPFSYIIHVDKELFDEEVKIPPMFTQPFVENSIEHGILNKKEKGEIEIRISKKENYIQIELIDNGIGINKAIFKKKNAKHRSFAIKITKERLKTLDKNLRKRTDLVITDLAGQDEKITGTQVTLKLPILY